MRGRKRAVQQTEWPSSEEACKQLMSEGVTQIALSFSRGKESIGSWLQLRRAGYKVHAIHRLVVPDLKFVEDSLRYYEDFFGEPILRVVNATFVDHMLRRNFMSPAQAEVREAACSLFPKITDRDLEGIFNSALRKLGLNPNETWEAHGWRRSDSMARAFALKRLGPIQRPTKTLEPIYDWSEKRLAQEIRDAGVKLPVDYKMFGRSFDDIRGRFLIPIKQYFPEDFERIRFFMPQVDFEVRRHHLEPYPYR